MVRWRRGPGGEKEGARGVRKLEEQNNSQQHDHIEGRSYFHHVAACIISRARRTKVGAGVLLGRGRGEDWHLQRGIKPPNPPPPAMPSKRPPDPPTFHHF